MEPKKRTLRDLARLPARELEEIFARGTTPDVDKLGGYEFMGYNVPFFAKLLGIKKFQKGFYRHEDGFFGYNIPQYQNDISEPWRCQPVDHNPRRFGFFSVKKVDPAAKENKEPGALILNYEDGHNWPWEGSFLRDYVKQADPDNDDLYLGKAYVALGPLRIMPSIFIIERLRPAPTPVEHFAK
jgi:hypothetical protein